MLDMRTAALAGTIAALTLSGAAHAQQSPAPDFIPDYTFDGSQLTGWRPLGQADWRAQNGVITGTARPGGGGGWLVFDRSYQDVALFSRFRCTGSCDAGVLLRAERTPEGGMKGILVALRNDTVAPYRVTLDASGRFLTRQLARNQGGGGGGGGGGGATAAPAPTSAVLQRATAELTAPVRVAPGEWNTIEVILDANSISNHLNNVRNATPGGTVNPPAPPASGGGGGVGGVVPPDTSRWGYGPVALYVGSGSVQFDDVSTKDLLVVKSTPERVSSRFRVQRIDDFYYAWGADVADIDRDGTPDVISGPFYYLGPDFTTRHEYYPARVFNPGLEYVNDMLTFAHDWNGDGWVDVLNNERRPLVLYLNPKGEARRWDRIAALPEVCSETAVRGDVDGDGQPEIVYVGGDGRVAYGEPDPANLAGPWLVRKISEPVVAGCNTHGVGIGDVNGDGRMDILQARGWWEQPAAGAASGVWIYHDAAFGRLTRSPQHPGGGEISVHDFNGDGLNDVVASHSAHGWGLSWYEQKRDAAGRISFVEHPIMLDYSTRNAGDVTFSQVHSGATLADVDRDGVMDFVTGKRHWSHLDSYSDPDPYGEGVIYWYRAVRNRSAPGGVEFVPELIHNRSGVGSEVKAVDIDRDGAMDFVTSGTRGTFIFWGAR